MSRVGLVVWSVLQNALLCGCSDEVGQRTADHAATPSQAQTMLTGNLKERETEHVELMELER